MNKQKTEKQKEDTVDKTEREGTTVDKKDEKASKVTQSQEVTKPLDEKIDETVDEESEERATSDERQETETTEPERKVKYVFPNASQCPRCRSHDTIAYRTDGKVQYRRCRRGHCRWRYSIIGLKEK